MMLSKPALLEILGGTNSECIRLLELDTRGKSYQ